MSLVINNNYAATVANDNLGASNTGLQRSLNRLSSGSRIVNPADDAGGLAVAMKLSAAAKSLNAMSAIIGNKISFLQTQDGVLKNAGAVLTRMSELATLYTDPTKTTTDIANYTTEFTALTNELATLSGETFNGLNLFGASAPAVGTAINLTTDVGTLSISSAAGISTALANVAADRATNGAGQGSLGYDADVATVTKANLEAAASRISDVDVAAESTQLAHWNVLVQYGAAMLAQANQSTQIAMKLLQ